MITAQLFNETKEVIEVVEESIEEKQTLEEEISHSVSLIDGAFRSIQEQILCPATRKNSPHIRIRYLKSTIFVMTSRIINFQIQERSSSV